MMDSVGFIMGPAVTFFFKSVKTNVGTWVLDYTNSPTLFLAVMFDVMQVITYFMVYDISKQRYLKSNYNSSNNDREMQSNTRGNANGSKVSCNDFIHLETFDIKSINIKTVKNRQLISKNIDENLLLIQKETTLVANKSAAFVLCSLVKTFDVVIIIITAWFVTFFIVCYDICLTPVVIETLQRSVTELAATIFATGVTCTLVCLFFILKKLLHQVNYITHLLCLWSFTLTGALFILLKYYGFSTWFRIFFDNYICSAKLYASLH